MKRDEIVREKRNDWRQHGKESFPTITIAAGLVLTILTCSLCAQSPDAGQRRSSNSIRKYTSKHFVIFSDLSSAEVGALQERLERTLHHISHYWRKPLKHRIECHIVDDLTNWPEDKLPNRVTRILLTHVGGVTVPRIEKSKTDDTRIKALVYASARRGVAEHEIVHAYCSQTFGTGGPDWYKEGMAELVSFRLRYGRGVHCPPEIIDYLHATPKMPLVGIVDGAKFTNALRDVLARIANTIDDRDTAFRSPLSGSWGPAEENLLQQVKQSYFCSWALCHFLTFNSNYSGRFHRLGQEYLQGVKASFEKTFSSGEKKLAFEFEFFLRHIEQGFRVDLCQWDWEQSFDALEELVTRPIVVKAASGYQASGSLLSEGHQYVFRSSGKWSVRRRGLKLTANGNRKGTGRLVGVVMSDYQLSPEFELGEAGSFIAPASGKLYLRCLDVWHEISDNAGAVRVVLRPK